MADRRKTTTKTVRRGPDGRTREVTTTVSQSRLAPPQPPRPNIIQTGSRLVNPSRPPAFGNTRLPTAAHRPSGIPSRSNLPRFQSQIQSPSRICPPQPKPLRTVTATSSVTTVTRRPPAAPPVTTTRSVSVRVQPPTRSPQPPCPRPTVRPVAKVTPPQPIAKAKAVPICVQKRRALGCPGGASQPVPVRAGVTKVVVPANFCSQDKTTVIQVPAGAGTCVVAEPAKDVRPRCRSRSRSKSPRARVIIDKPPVGSQITVTAQVHEPPQSAARRSPRTPPRIPEIVITQPTPPRPRSPSPPPRQPVWGDPLLDEEFGDFGDPEFCDILLNPSKYDDYVYVQKHLMDREDELGIPMSRGLTFEEMEDLMEQKECEEIVAQLNRNHAKRKEMERMKEEQRCREQEKMRREILADIMKVQNVPTLEETWRAQEAEKEAQRYEKFRKIMESTPPDWDNDAFLQSRMENLDDAMLEDINVTLISSSSEEEEGTPDFPFPTGTGYLSFNYDYVDDLEEHERGIRSILVTPFGRPPVNVPVNALETNYEELEDFTVRQNEVLKPLPGDDLIDLNDF